MTVAQFVFGMYLTIHFASQPGTYAFVCLRRKYLRRNTTPKATAIPAIPLDGFRFCIYQRWRTGEIIYAALTGVYGASPSISAIRGATTNPFRNKDSSAFFTIIYSAKHLGRMRAQGVPSLLSQVIGDATTYFLIIFTSQILVISFEIFAPVSDHPIGLCSSVDDMRLVVFDSTHSRDVSQRLRCCNRDNFD